MLVARHFYYIKITINVITAIAAALPARNAAFISFASRARYQHFASRCGFMILKPSTQTIEAVKSHATPRRHDMAHDARAEIFSSRSTFDIGAHFCPPPPNSRRARESLAKKEGIILPRLFSTSQPWVKSIRDRAHFNSYFIQAKYFIATYQREPSLIRSETRFRYAKVRSTRAPPTPSRENEKRASRPASPLYRRLRTRQSLLDSDATNAAKKNA